MAIPADIVFSGGKVPTGDAESRVADWVWVRGGRVVALGSGAPPEVDAGRVDLAGRVLCPAFVDAHVHLSWLATSLLGPDLSRCKNRDDLLHVIASWKQPGRGPEGAWIVGHGFDESAWTDRRTPLRAELDAVQPSRPVVAMRACGHVAVLNSAALRDVAPGPHTDLETGRLAEDDLYAINDRLRPEPQELAAALPRVAAHLHAHGITAVHDVASPEMLAALRMQRSKDGLGIRVSCSIPYRYLDANLDLAPSGEPLDGPCRDDEFLRVLGVKLFLDGSLGARTAWLRAPYADAPETRGTPLFALEGLRAIARRAQERGLQLMVHAIGDAALDLGLDALEPVSAGGNPLRHRLEHVEVTPPDLVVRLARSGMWICAQPNFAARWSHPDGMNAQRLGPRLAHCNAYRSLHDAGIPLGFGSDTMPLGPALGLHGACRHPIAAERLSVLEALRAYTTTAAALVHAEHRQGRIAPGLAADFVLLAADPRDLADPGTIAVEATYVAGNRVHGAVAAPGDAC
jgi:hypothetical protein